MDSKVSNFFQTFSRKKENAMQDRVNKKARDKMQEEIIKDMKNIIDTTGQKLRAVK